MVHVPNMHLFWKIYSPLQELKLEQIRIHETLQGLSTQMGTLQQKTLELEKNTSLDWRMQSIEDINTLQSRMQRLHPALKPGENYFTIISTGPSNKVKTLYGMTCKRR